MANPTWSSVFSGRLPGFGSSKLPGGRGLRVAYGALTYATATYPDGGYAASTLESLTGFSRIEAIVPCGSFTNGTHENAFPASWDGAARTLQVLGNRVQDGNALTVGTGQAASEIATDSTAPNSAVLYCLIIGF